jgi:tetratricopeptide (TPR) repeat protein
MPVDVAKPHRTQKRRHVSGTVCILAVALAGLGGCRTPPPTFPAPAPAATAAPPAAIELPPDPAVLVRRGCFACLERALAQARDQNRPDVAFEAAALLALRAKELGMAHGDWFEQARQLAAGDGARQFMLDVVDALPVDPRSGARDELLSQTPRRLRAAALSPQWVESLASGSASLEFRSYLQLALTCASEDYAVTKAEDVEAGVPEAVRDAPLLRYRLGICGSAHGPTLRALRAADAEFVDADYALGRYAVQVRGYPDLDEALRLLRSAASAFPGSPAIASMGGGVYQMIEAWNEALAAYDAALVLVPDHPDALIGRTVALSNLERHRDAITTATRLIEHGRWFVGQALYWRAWNQFQLGEYPLAREDADRARTIMVNPGVYLLSGMIDWRLRRLESAEREFEEALRMDFGQCEAATFLGGVRNELSKAPGALEAFKQAERCYSLTITLRREAIARLEDADATPAHKAREIARHQRAIEQAEKRRAEAMTGIDILQNYLTSSPPRSQSRRP